LAEHGPDSTGLNPRVKWAKFEPNNTKQMTGDLRALIEENRDRGGCLMNDCKNLVRQASSV